MRFATIMQESEGWMNAGDTYVGVIFGRPFSSTNVATWMGKRSNITWWGYLRQRHRLHHVVSFALYIHSRVQLAWINVIDYCVWLLLLLLVVLVTKRPTVMTMSVLSWLNASTCTIVQANHRCILHGSMCCCFCCYSCCDFSSNGIKYWWLLSLQFASNYKRTACVFTIVGRLATRYWYTKR